MKLNNSVKYSALFFLIFIFGILFFVASINRSLEKKTQIIKHPSAEGTKSLASNLTE